MTNPNSDFSYFPPFPIYGLFACQNSFLIGCHHQWCSSCCLVTVIVLHILPSLPPHLARGIGWFNSWPSSALIKGVFCDPLPLRARGLMAPEGTDGGSLRSCGLGPCRLPSSRDHSHLLLPKASLLVGIRLSNCCLGSSKNCRISGCWGGNGARCIRNDKSVMGSAVGQWESARALLIVDKGWSCVLGFVRLS